MFGFLFGTACLIGFIKVAKAGRCGGYGYAGYGGYGGGCGGGGWHGHHHGGGRWGHGARFGGGRFGSRGPLRYVFARLETTPGQEKVIAEEVENVFSVLRESKGHLSEIRQTLAEALKSPVFNNEAFAELQAKQETTGEKIRETVRTSLAKIHEVLDDRQRKELAAILEGGFGGFGRGRGNWV